MKPPVDTDDSDDGSDDDFDDGDYVDRDDDSGDGSYLDTPTTPTRNRDNISKYRQPQYNMPTMMRSEDGSEDGSGNRDNIPITTKNFPIKKYLRQKKYVHHPQYHTPTRAMLKDVSSDSELDDSSFEKVEQEEVDKVEDDRHIVYQTLSKISVGRKHRRHNFAFTIAQKIDIVLLAKEWNNVRGTARYFGVWPRTFRNWRDSLPLLRDRAYFNPNVCTVNKGRQPDDPNLEEVLNDWCESLLAENISFRTDNILQHAITIKPDLIGGNEKKAKRWVYDFMERWNLSVCKVTHVGQQV
jgi:Tc5 transposase DNA-binding domain